MDSDQSGRGALAGAAADPDRGRFSGRRTQAIVLRLFRGEPLETFPTVADLRRALAAFKRRRNEGWLVERHGVRTPARARADL